MTSQLTSQILIKVNYITCIIYSLYNISKIIFLNKLYYLALHSTLLFIQPARQFDLFNQSDC